MNGGFSAESILRPDPHDDDPHDNVLMRTPVVLKIALAIAAIGGTQAISPAPLVALKRGC